MIRTLTRDLSRLQHALSTADFGGTREFPKLPRPRTIEVAAIVEKLQTLHGQAAQVYAEMWLFLGRAAHQLKTPGAALQATAEVLLRRPRTPDELIEGISDLKRGVDQMNHLTKKLMESSRTSFRPVGHAESLLLKEFLDKQVRAIAHLSARIPVTIAVDCDPALAWFGDSDLLSEVIGNILENAILYSRPDGAVSVAVKDLSATIAVTVSDQGDGFPEPVRQRLFEPFVRGDERIADGSGLGLSIAKRAADHLSASLKLLKSGRQGTVFEILLPKKLG